MSVSPVQPNLALILWGAEQQLVYVFQGPRALYSVAALNEGPGSCLTEAHGFTDSSIGSVASNS